MSRMGLSILSSSRVVNLAAYDDSSYIKIVEDVRMIIENFNNFEYKFDSYGFINLNFNDKNLGVK